VKHLNDFIYLLKKFIRFRHEAASYGSFEEMKKGTSAIHGAMFILSKWAWCSEKGAWCRTILFFFR
jgi:hypothetical protein